MTTVNDRLDSLEKAQEENLSYFENTAKILQAILDELKRHSTLLEQHTGLLQEHSASLSTIGETQQEHTGLLRDISGTLMTHSIELSLIKGYLDEASHR